VSFDESRYEQTRVVRDAVEMAVRLLQGYEDRRDEIASVIFRIPNHEMFAAPTLANLAIETMTESDRKTG
jgi:hypothetical protein